MTRPHASEFVLSPAAGCARILLQIVRLECSYRGLYPRRFDVFVHFSIQAARNGSEPPVARVQSVSTEQHHTLRHAPTLVVALLDHMRNWAHVVPTRPQRSMGASRSTLRDHQSCPVNTNPPHSSATCPTSNAVRSRVSCGATIVTWNGRLSRDARTTYDAMHVW